MGESVFSKTASDVFVCALCMSDERFSPSVEVTLRLWRGFGFLRERPSFLRLQLSQITIMPWKCLSCSLELRLGSGVRVCAAVYARTQPPYSEARQCRSRHFSVAFNKPRDEEDNAF